MTEAKYALVALIVMVAIGAFPKHTLAIALVSGAAWALGNGIGSAIMVIRAHKLERCGRGRN